MKCRADERDHCHNPTWCKRFYGVCPYFPYVVDPKTPLDTIKFINNEGKEVGRIENIKMPETEPRIPEFISLLEASKEIHLKKNQDYASSSNPFSNFERSALLMSWFDDPVDKAFVSLIGTKLARLAELRNGNREPKNESIYDTFLDLGTYCFLWGAYVIRTQFSRGDQC